jgi:hypothetical protein
MGASLIWVNWRLFAATGVLVVAPVIWFQKHSPQRDSAGKGGIDQTSGEKPRSEREMNMRLLSKSLGATASAIAMALAGAVNAQDLPIIGQPLDKGIGFQPASTIVAEHTFALEHMILIIISVIVVFVTGLLIWVIVRYNQRANPKPAGFTHNTPLEIAWTLVPIPDPGVHRRLFAAGAVQAGRDPGGRGQHQGDRQPVVLVL